jgi:hypothetical protein
VAALSTTSSISTRALLACQKPFDQFCNRDELQFQVVHQVEELWMKLAPSAWGPPRSRAARWTCCRRAQSSVSSRSFWEVRGKMTDAWGGTYGKVRESISATSAVADEVD